LIEVYIEGPTLEEFCADETIDLWLEECPTSRKPHQSTRNSYRSCKKKSTSDESETEDNSIELDIDKWDAWFCDDSSDDVSDTE